MPTTHNRPVATLLATVLLAAGCTGQTAASPDLALPSLETESQPTRPTATPRPVATPRPTPIPDLGCKAIVAAQPGPRPEPTLPPDPNPSIEDADARSIAAFDRAAIKLEALDSYRFLVDIFNVDALRLERSSLAFALRGTINRSDDFAMDAAVLTQMGEPDGSAAITSTVRVIVGDEFAWVTGNVSGVLEPSRVGAGNRAFYLALTPDGLASRLLIPFAGGYERVGDEMHAGVMTRHFRATPQGAAAYASAFHFDGEVTADVWIASDGGYVAGARIAGKASVRDPLGAIVEDAVLVQFEVTNPNDPANVVEMPTAPVPDPVRPSGPPVDLRLEYEVMRSTVRDPTTRDVDEVGVTLRRRLGSGTRPVKVRVAQADRIVVTICGTTQPQEDRRLISSNAALTVVPLPAGEYGTKTKPGAKALPAVGEPLDPELKPVAPPEGLGHTRTHVDPATGRRGLAFWLGNNASRLFHAYAEEHPGEHVAIVLDGTVIATLPIDDQVTKRGTFAFTGDYTEAEVQSLLEYLQADPLAFPVRLAGEVEIPASR